MRRNKQVVRADQGASSLQHSPDLGVVRRRLVRKIEHSEVTQKTLDRGTVLLLAWRQFDAK